MRATILAVLLAAAGLAVMAQEDENDFSTWMKRADAATERLRKLEPKTGKEAVASAERIGGIYENMIEFWRQRAAPNAVKLSEAGKAAALELATAAHAGDGPRAAAAFKTLDGTCLSCHDTYREQTAEGKYRIKQ